MVAVLAPDPFDTSVDSKSVFHPHTSTIQFLLPENLLESLYPSLRT